MEMPAIAQFISPYITTPYGTPLQSAPQSTPQLFRYPPTYTITGPTYSPELTSQNNNNNGFNIMPDKDPNSLYYHSDYAKLSSSPNNIMDNTNINLTMLKLLMSGKEVGCIIGKKGENIKKIREDSCAKINVSDGNTAERIVTISGSSDQITMATDLICKKIENVDGSNSDASSTCLSIRLLLSPTQSLWILGDNGDRFKRLKESANVTLLIGADMYTHSTEKLFTIAGTPDSVALCLAELNRIFQDINTTIYESLSFPFPGISLVPFQNLLPPVSMVSGEPLSYPMTPVIPIKFSPVPINPSPAPGLLSPPPPVSINNNVGQKGRPLPLIPTSIHHHHHQQQHHHSQSLPVTPINHHPQQLVFREFYVYNDVIGCVIGRGGATINEIRNISGAQIKISNCEEGRQERRISITGNLEAVQTAQLLINSSIEAFKQAGNVNSLSSQPLTSFILSHLKQKQAAATSSALLFPPPPPTSNNATLLNPSSILSNTQLISNQPLSITQNILQLNPISQQTLHELHANYTTNFSMNDDFIKSNQNVLKMKPTQVNLDGSIKSNSTSIHKYKPY